MLQATTGDEVMTKGPMWRLESDSNLLAQGTELTTEPSHSTIINFIIVFVDIVIIVLFRIIIIIIIIIYYNNNYYYL